MQDACGPVVLFGSDSFSARKPHLEDLVILRARITDLNAHDY